MKRIFHPPFLILLFVSSCALFRGEKYIRVNVDAADIAEARVTGDIAMYSFRVNGGELDSFLIEIMTQESMPDHFECHLLHPSKGMKCEAYKRDKWVKKENRNSRDGSITLYALCYLECNGKKYRIKARYEGKTQNAPPVKPY